MNYLKAYSNLISKAQNEIRNKNDSYFELHHILPKCQGGLDEDLNLVLLTAREHFIAHMLLWKNDRTNYLLFAPLLYFKRHKHVKNSRTFEEVRLIHAKFMSDDNPSARLCEESKMSRKTKLRTYSLNRPKEHNKKISDTAKGKQRRLGAVLEDISKTQIAESLKKYFAENSISDETREKLRIANTGKKHSKESLAKQKVKALNRQKFQCPHCDKMMDAGNLKQHIKRHELKGNK